MGERRHRGFRSLRGGRATAVLTGFEADLLRSLAGQLIELLRSERAIVDKDPDPLEALLDLTGPVEPPDDPVLARLFPTAYREDDEAAADFRRFTETELRDGKAGQAGAIIDSLEEAGLTPEVTGDEVVELELLPDQVMAWMRGLTDLRLALAVRLGIEDDSSWWEDLPDDDPRSHLVSIYEWLGFLQETLVQAVS